MWNGQEQVILRTKNVGGDLIKVAKLTNDGEDEWGNDSQSYENATAATSLQGFRKQLDGSLEERPPRALAYKDAAYSYGKLCYHNKLERGKTCWASTVTHLPCPYILTLPSTLSQWHSTGLGKPFLKPSRVCFMFLHPLSGTGWVGLLHSTWIADNNSVMT